MARCTENEGHCLEKALDKVVSKISQKLSSVSDLKRSKSVKVRCNFCCNGFDESIGLEQDIAVLASHLLGSVSVENLKILSVLNNSGHGRGNVKI